MLTRKMIMGAILLLCTMFSVTVLAQTYYVDPDGNDSATGLSWATAVATIQKGVSKANTGDIVEVNQGTYMGPVRIENKAITLQSIDPNDWSVIENTIIEPNQGVFYYIQGITLYHPRNGNSIIRGLTVDGTGRSVTGKCMVGILAHDRDDILIENCVIKNIDSNNNSAYGIYIDNQEVNTPSYNIQVKSCRINDICNVSTSGSHSARGILIGTGPNLTDNILIDNCVFSEIRSGNPYQDGDAIHAQTSIIYYPGTSYYYWGAMDLTIQKCEFSNFSKRAVKLQCSDATVENCTLGNSDFDYYFAGGICIISGNNNTVQNNYIDFSSSDMDAGGIGISWGKNNTIEDNIIKVRNTSVGAHGRVPGLFLDDANENYIHYNYIRGQYGIEFYNSSSTITPWDGSSNNDFKNNAVLYTSDVYYQHPNNGSNVNTTTPNTLPWVSSSLYDVNETVIYDSNDIYKSKISDNSSTPTDLNNWDHVEEIPW